MKNFFKDLVYSREDVITFPSGLPGFEDHTQFVVTAVPEYAPFEWLVCIDGAKLRFAVINPMLFRPDYNPKMVKKDLQGLAIQKPEDLLMYAIVTIKENPLESTANLVGPILVNKNKRLGKQIILDSDVYTTREPIIGK